MTTTQATPPAVAFAPSSKARASRRLLGRWLRRIALGAIVLAVTAGIVLAFMPRALPVDTAPVGRGRFTVTVSEDGHARVKDRYVLVAPLTGSLQRIRLRAGTDVRQGETVARLLPAPPALLDERSREQAEARLRGAQAAARQASLQAQRVQSSAEQAALDSGRTRELFRKGAVPQAEFDRATLSDRIASAELESARFGVRVAEYDVEMARAALRHIDSGRAVAGTRAFEVPAPVTGRVLRVLRESEGLAQAGTALIELAEPGALEIVVDVLTSDAVRIARGAPVVLDRWGGPELSGNVRLVEPSAFTQVNALGVEEQRVNVIIDIADPPERWSMLGDGYRVEAHVAVWDGPDVVQVPLSATFRDGNGWAVYRVDDGVARLARVELGERTMTSGQVVRGLRAGDTVIVHPSDKVTEGIRVKAR
jgi:HlyD family secretion protein